MRNDGSKRLCINSGFYVIFVALIVHYYNLNCKYGYDIKTHARWHTGF